MSKLLIAAVFLCMSPNPTWLTSLDSARETARKENKLILLYFSGSDWCIPCISMREAVYNSTQFSQFAGEHLVLVNADFPRLKKNQLPKELQKANDKLADVYNPTGVFPLSVLLDQEGRKLKIWEGYYKNGPDNFIQEIKTAGGIE